MLKDIKEASSKNSNMIEPKSGSTRVLMKGIHNIVYILEKK
jgi:hypothetical protein